MTWTGRLRQWHGYLGLLIAPSVLFFAVTGALQIFNLHEAHGDYRPAVWIEKLSAVHKDQVFEEPHKPSAVDNEPKSAPPRHLSDRRHRPPGDEHEKSSGSTLALKWYFCGVAAGLFVSTLIGVWMGVTQLRRKWLVWMMLIAGTLAPLGTFVI